MSKNTIRRLIPKEELLIIQFEMVSNIFMVLSSLYEILIELPISDDTWDNIWRRIRGLLRNHNVQKTPSETFYHLLKKIVQSEIPHIRIKLVKDVEPEVYGDGSVF